MRNHITLRSTLSNVPWSQRLAALLIMTALILALALALQPITRAPAPAPAVRHAAPAVRNPNAPAIGTGSAYDGGSYVTKRAAVRNPNTPVIGTGSAYDGQ